MESKTGVFSVCRETIDGLKTQVLLKSKEGLNYANYDSFPVYGPFDVNTSGTELHAGMIIEAVITDTQELKVIRIIQ